MQKYLIKDWYIIGKNKNTTEVSNSRLGGKVYNNPQFSNGTEIITSKITTVNGREVVCSTGSVYVLEGEPNTQYLSWCEKNGYVIDQDNPIKTKIMLRFF